MSLRLRNVTSSRGIALWGGLLILLLAALLRLAGFEETLLAWDQSYLISDAITTASLHPPLAGIKSSVGVYQTAVISYLAAIPLLIVPRVIAIKWFFSILDLLAVAIFYYAVRRTFGYRAATVTTALYAVSPAVVEFVRWIWYQSLVPTWATISFSCFLLIVARAVQRRSLWFALGLISATLMGTVHLAALPWTSVLFLVGLILAWRDRTLRWGWWLGVGGSVLIVIPYLIFLLTEGGQDAAHLLHKGTQNAGWNVFALRLAREMVAGEVHSLPGGSIWDPVPPWFHRVGQLFLYLLALSTLWVIVQILGDRTRSRPARIFVLLWALASPLLYLCSDVHIQHFYLLYLFPSHYVLIGAAFQPCLPGLAQQFALCGQGREMGVLWAGYAHPRNPDILPATRWSWRLFRGIQTVLLVLVLAYALIWAAMWGTRIRLERSGLRVAPTRAWLMDQTADRIREHLHQYPDCQVVIISSFAGDGSAFDWIRTLLRTDRVRIVSAGNGLIIPPGCACYMLGPDASEQDLAPVLDRVVEQPQMTIPARPPWRFYCAQERGDVPSPVATWQNGLALLRTDVEAEWVPNGQVQVTYLWHYHQVTSGRYHFFNHLFCGDQLVAQMDGPAVPPWYWRNDDLLVTRFYLRLPPVLDAGECRLRMGMYSWPDMQRVLMDNGQDIYEVMRWNLQ